MHTRMWRNLADAPVSETGCWGFESLHPHSHCPQTRDPQKRIPRRGESKTIAAADDRNWPS